MYSVIRLNETHTEILEEFCYEAGLAGYANNASLEAMKFNGQYDLKDTPSFWALFKDHKIISVSGCHYWYDDFEEPSMMRCLFRSATLPHYDNVITGLNKYHMNSLPFSVMLPLQINQGLRSCVKHFYIHLLLFVIFKLHIKELSLVFKEFTKFKITTNLCSHL